MKISIYIPKDLEKPLLAEAREAGESPSLFVQSLVRDRLEGKREAFSDEFAALAGSWEDIRSVDEIIRDIEGSRTSSEHPPLR